MTLLVGDTYVEAELYTIASGGYLDCLPARTYLLADLLKEEAPECGSKRALEHMVEVRDDA